MGKMSLNNVVSGKLVKPVRVLIHGTEGVGKSTFAADAPSPIFLCPEDGTSQLDIERFPEPADFGEVLEALDVLQHDDHDRSTLVLDTADWLEPLIWEAVCAKAKKPNIEAFGFGKGYVAALDEWRGLVARLDRLRAKGMHIVIVAHSHVKPFNNPEGENFDRYELKLHGKAAGLLKEWSDAVLFASFEQATYEDGSRHKGISTGARVMRTERRAAFDAKNRYGLPFELPLSWPEFWAGVQSDGGNTQQLVDEIRELSIASGLTVDELLAKAGNDATKLAKLREWLRAKMMKENAA